MELDPTDVNAWNIRGADLANLQKYDEAIESYDKALELDPKYARVWNNRGLTLASQQKYDKAIE